METAPLPISLVAHTVFCPRRTWLEAAGERVGSGQIEAGLAAHRRVDHPGDSRAHEQVAIDIHDDQLGITGRCDVLRLSADGRLRLIEYKATPVRRRAEVTPAQEVQLALQGLCLESMGYEVEGASVHFPHHGVTVPVILTEELSRRAADYVALTRRLLADQSAPPPPTEDVRCRYCSHAGVCLPEENSGRRSTGISASNPDGEILHVVQQGARVQVKTGRLQVVAREDELASLPLERVVGLVLHGNVDVSSAVVRELLWRRSTIVWCSGRGRVTGWASSADSPNGGIRIKQDALSIAGCLPLASEFIAAKTANQATLLRRNATGLPDSVTRELRTASRASRKATSLPELFAIEGRAAALYFEHFPLMIHSGGAWALAAWPGRHGRHAQDAMNAAMNYLYGLLAADCIRAIVACGLDPSGGFLHSSSRNKPALALDLMEEFRAPLADSTLLRTLNNGELRPSMFFNSLGDARLTDEGRRTLVAAYEARASAEIKHPTFGYPASWRRTIEIQARLLLSYLDGTRSEYRGIVTR